MKTIKDKVNFERCLAYLKLKAVDYNVNLDLSALEPLRRSIEQTGMHLDKVSQHIRETISVCLSAQKCTDSTIADRAFEIIDKAVKEFIDLTDTAPGLVARMSPKDLMEVVEDFNDDLKSKQIAAYALNQFQLEKLGSPSTNETLDTFNADYDESDDEFELEEEEEEEIFYVK